MYIVICEHNLPWSFIDFMHSNTCFQLFKYIFVKTWIYTQIFKIVKTWKIGKTWISPPKFQNPEKTVKMRNYTPQCWTRIGTAGYGRSYSFTHETHFDCHVRLTHSPLHFCCEIPRLHDSSNPPSSIFQPNSSGWTLFLNYNVYRN